MEKNIQSVFEVIIEDLKREVKSDKSEDYKKGISAAMLIIFSALRRMEESE